MTMTHEELFEKYPRIFQDYEGNPGRCNWQVPEHWLPIIDDLCDLIQQHCDNKAMVDNPDYVKGKKFDINDITTQVLIKKNREQVTCNQMKEKFGGLRFYINSGDEYVYALIRYAEHLSYRTCIGCGANKPEDDVQLKIGWIEPYCKKCRETNGYITIEEAEKNRKNESTETQKKES